MLFPIIMIVVGVALAAVNTWQHLGRGTAARQWSATDKYYGANIHQIRADRAVLVVMPAGATFFVAVGVYLLLPEDVFLLQSSPWEPVACLAGLLMLASLVFALPYLLFPLPVPRWLKPRWYREEEKKHPPKRRSRRTRDSGKR